MRISFRPYGYTREDMISAVEAMSHPFAFSGLKRRELEEKLCHLTGRAYAIATRDPVMPLLHLLKFLGFKEGDSFLISPLSYRPHLSPYLQLTGLKPLYVDVERWFFNIDMSRMKGLVEDVKLLVINNSLGIPADWDRLYEVLEGKDVFILEDSRETLFTRYKGRRVGSFGNVSLIEFQESSILRGYGGAILTDDPNLYRVIKDWAEPMEDLMCGIVLSQTRELEERKKLRDNLVKVYQNLLKGIEGLKAQFTPEYVKDMHWNYFCVHLGKRYKEEAMEIIRGLMLDDGIEVMLYPKPQDLKEGNSLSYLHIAHEIGTRALLLPMHEDLEEEDIYLVCERLKEHVLQVGAGSRDH